MVPRLRSGGYEEEEGGWKREKEGKCFNRRTTTTITTTTTIVRWLFRAAREDKKVERIDWLREDYHRDYLN